MKLNEIFVGNQPKEKSNIPSKHVRRYSRHDMMQGAKKSGQTGKSGVQAKVFRHPKDPTKVVKYADLGREDPAHDGYVRYINTILKHQNNPFFPRIYNAKIVHHSSGKATLVVVMEKLHFTFDTPALQDSGAAIIQSLGIDLEDPLNANDGYALLYYFDSSSKREELRNATKNPKLKEALSIMEPFFDLYGSDQHNENVAFRLTKVGPQLVFADPFMPSYYD